MNTAEIAARWWADQLRMPAKQDVGYTLGTIARTLQANYLPALPADKIAAFAAALAPAIDAARDEWGECIIDVDYEADSLLERAAEIAGIDLTMRLPAKTVMWVDRIRVQVRCGYGAQTETIE